MLSGLQAMAVIYKVQVVIIYAVNFVRRIATELLEPLLLAAICWVAGYPLTQVSHHWWKCMPLLFSVLAHVARLFQKLNHV